MRDSSRLTVSLLLFCHLILFMLFSSFNIDKVLTRRRRNPPSLYTLQLSGAAAALSQSTAVFPNPSANNSRHTGPFTSSDGNHKDAQPSANDGPATHADRGQSGAELLHAVEPLTASELSRAPVWFQYAKGLRSLKVAM